MAETTTLCPALLGLGLLQLVGGATVEPGAQTTASLVPAEAHPSQLSYFTTWSAQGYVFGANDELPLADYVKNSTSIAHAVLTARYAFTAASKLPGAGWADFYPKARGDLWFLLDAGWAEDGKTSGSNIWMNATKWPFDIPERNSTSPTDRLGRFNAAVQKLGWKGGALWFGALNNFEKSDAPFTIEELATWSRDAGINYWKVDFCADTYVTPCALARRARAVHPALTFEHGCPTSPFPSFVPFNEGKNGRLDPSMLGHWAIMLNCTDVLRTYDTADALVIPQTLERIQSLLQLAPTLTRGREALGDGSSHVLCASSTALPFDEFAEPPASDDGATGPPPLTCEPPRDPDLPPDTPAGTPLTLQCPPGSKITSVLLADFGKAAGTCLPALSPSGCVAQWTRWCESCPRCMAFDTLFSESVQFHSCGVGHINSRGNNWDLYLRNDSFATRYVATKVDGSSCPTQHILPNAKCNENRTSGVFSVDPTCTSPNTLAAVSALCVGKAQCTIPTDNTTLFGGAPCEGGPSDWRLVVKALCESQSPGHENPDSGSAAPQDHVRGGVINGDAEAYPIAGLGCSMGIMRGQTTVLRPFPDQDQQTGWDLNGTNRHIKFRVDEASRATRWQRLGPPFGIHEQGGDLLCVDGALVDSWAFRPGETWYASDVSTHPKQQGAPARMARGVMRLPIVTAAANEALLPFVTVCRYPTGVASVTTLGRVLPYPRGYSLPHVNVSINIDWPGNGILPLVGVFGRYANLNVHFTTATDAGVFDRPIGSSGMVQILAQDLLSDGPPTDIAARVGVEQHLDGGLLIRIPGALIDTIGTAARSNTKDVSDPGLVLSVTSVDTLRHTRRMKTDEHADGRASVCETWESDPVACVRSYANVEWTTLLPFIAPGTYGQNAMPIGNGDFGALVSTDGIATVIIALKAASAYDESGQIFTPGVLNVTFGPMPPAGSAFKMSFDAGDASVTINIGSLQVLLWFDAVGDKLVIQHSSSDSTVYTAAQQVFIGRPFPQIVPGQIHWDCFAYNTSADRTLATDAEYAFWHHNAPTLKSSQNNYWHNQVRSMNMGGDSTYNSVPNILSSRTTGGVVRQVTANTITVTLRTTTGKNEQQWLSEVNASASQGLPHKNASDVWWRAFWGRSHVQVSDMLVSRAHVWERYINAIQGRAPYNIHFNGMTFHTPRPADISHPPQRSSGQNIDNMGLWAGSHCWWNNCRQSYYYMHASGDTDLLESMFEMHARTVPSRRAQTLHYYNISGIYWGEYTDVFGADQNVGYMAADTNGLDCSTVKRNASWPHWYFPERWNHYNLQGSLDLAQMVLNHYTYTRSDKYMHMAWEVLDFYRQWRTERDSHGKMVIWPTQAQEYCQCVVYPPDTTCIQNDMPTVSALHAVVSLMFASGWLDSDQQAKLEALKAVLPDVPGVKNGSLWGDGLNQCPGPQETTQYPVHPYVLFSVGQGTANATAVHGFKGFLERTVNDVPRSSAGYIETPVRAALLGLAHRAKWGVHDRANGTRKPQEYRFPGLFAGVEGPNSGPASEVMGFGSAALQYMLLQEDFSSAHKLTLLPAWPCDWDVEFKLHAALQTTVVGKVVNGVLTYDVTPARRRADVCVMPCQREPVS